MTLLQLLDKAQELADQGLIDRAWLAVKREAAKELAELALKALKDERILLSEIHRMLKNELAIGIIEGLLFQKALAAKEEARA